MTTNLLGVLFGLISMLGFGLGNAMSQKPSQNLGSVKMTFYRQFFMSLLLLPILLLNLNKAIFSVEYILIALGISFIGYIPLVSFFRAINLGKVGVITPIANSSMIFTVLFSVIFYGEKLSTQQIYSIAVIVIGIILISIDFKDFKNSHLFNRGSGIMFAFISMFLWGVVFALFKIPVNVIGPVLTSFIIEFGIMLFSGATMILKKSSFLISDNKVLFKIMLIAVFGSLAGLFYNFGINKYNISLIASISSSSPLIATLYGRLFYKEHIKKMQWVAIFVIIGGIISLSYSGV